MSASDRHHARVLQLMRALERDPSLENEAEAVAYRRTLRNARSLSQGARWSLMDDLNDAIRDAIGAREAARRVSLRVLQGEAWLSRPSRAQLRLIG